MPTKSEWDRHLKRIYEGKASVAEVADELGVTKSDVSQMHDRFLKELLKERERKLDQLEKDVEEKERRIKSLSEGIKRTDKKLKETEEKLPEMSKLEEMTEEWEQKIRKFSNMWRESKKKVRNILIIAVILILVLGTGTYFLIWGGSQSTKFRVENLRLGSKKAFVGKSITLYLDVVNVGGSAGTYKANLEFNGELVKKKEVALNPDERQTISITGTVEENGPIQVRIGGLTDNFVAFNLPPFEGAYAEYETKGVVVSVGETSGTETYKVTNVTEEDYIQKLIPKEGLTTINETQEFTASLETPLSIKDKEWEEYVFVENVTMDTEFGRMKLLHYRREIEAENRHLYLEENTRIPIYFKFEGSFGFMFGKIVKTNINYLKEN